jgi:hypothetical protein
MAAGKPESIKKPVRSRQALTLVIETTTIYAYLSRAKRRDDLTRYLEGK